MDKKQVNALIKLIAFLVLLTGGYTFYDTYYDSNTVKIANWNLQIFGTAKASNPELMNFYVDKINNYDIIFIQEIRDSSETAFPKLCSLLQDYFCKISSRAGRSSSKEQYGIIYKNGIGILSFTDYNPDSQDRWERPPIKTTFNISSYELTTYNIHIKPEDALAEITALQNIVVDSGNVLILGDLNADCNYYNNKQETEFDSWHWAISDNKDTTASATNCAYDRIILNLDAEAEFKTAGIDSTGITTEISDHYLIWVELGV